jgi:hypothetical protein
MRIAVWVLAIAMLVMASAIPAVAEDQSTSCRTLSLRGHNWADCCTRSYARRAAGMVSRRARMEQIERCARNGGRLPS